MPSRLRLWPSWEAQLALLLPQLRVPRVRVLARFVLGTVWSGPLGLLRIAATLPVSATDVSTERRFPRWLANAGIVVPVWGRARLPALLIGQAGQELTLVCDPTPQNGTATILCLSLVVPKRPLPVRTLPVRTLPVAGRVVPQPSAWAERQITYLQAMMEERQAALPPGCVVTLGTDRGISGPAVIDGCRAVGWHDVLRVKAGATQTGLVRLGDGPVDLLWALVTGPGQRWAGMVDVVPGAGWRTVALTIRWDPGAPEPWVLGSDRLAGGSRADHGSGRTADGSMPTPPRPTPSGAASTSSGVR